MKTTKLRITVNKLNEETKKLTYITDNMRKKREAKEPILHFIYFLN
jgi:hypothetical protein